MNLTRRGLLLASPQVGMLIGASQARASKADDRFVEKIFSGTVESVIERKCQICKAMELSVRLKTSAGKPELRLGPKTLFEEHNFMISRGDSITVTGLHYTERGKEIVLANEVRNGGETLVLRGEHGRPAWLDVQGHTCPICEN